ncbi:hypothetical protein ACQ4N7_25015 [Nodosilinea sp. AN01ver1]|uniref:hypothetical protein n=1 Tax=Nodosilinea sp. AN01ver1 TaxID=3423362 RepID=UPI003D311137
MNNSTLHSLFNLLSLTRLPEGNYQSDALADSTPLGVNHRVILTALSVVTPLLVLVNCLDQIQTAFVAVPMQSTLAIAQSAYPGHDYNDDCRCRRQTDGTGQLLDHNGSNHIPIVLESPMNCQSAE